MKVLPQRKRTRSKNRRAKRSFQKWRRFFSKYTTFFLISVGLAVLVYVVFVSSLFSLSSIEVTITPNENELEGESLKQEIKREVAQDNLLFFKPRRLSFLEDDPTIERFEIKKQWPSGLSVAITKRVPRAVLEDSMGRFFLVDGAGVVFARAGDFDLPLIKYSGVKLAIGDVVASREIDFVLYVLDAVSNSDFQIDSIQAGTDARLKVSDGPEVLLSLDDKSSVDHMIELVADFKSRGVFPVRIDLRYTNAVIEY